MNLIPTWPFVLGALVIGAAGGSYAMHAVMSNTINDMKLEAATSLAADSQLALDNYKAAAEVVTEAALGARTDLSTLTAGLAVIRKGQKNAPPAPLPVDCKPGPVRLRNLSETATAADAAIAGSVPRK